MKPIQVMFDEALLRRLDADEEVRQSGRSAVMRKAVDEYLRKRRVTRTAEAYKRAYGSKRATIDRDVTGWPGEGVWPEK